MTALTALLAGLATAIGVLALLTRGVLTTLLAAVTLIFLAAVLTATFMLTTLVLTTLAPTLLLSTVLPALVLLVTILIHKCFSWFIPPRSTTGQRGAFRQGYDKFSQVWLDAWRPSAIAADRWVAARSP